MNLRRLFRLPRRSSADVLRDVDDELAFHLEMRAEELAGGGLSLEAARAAAVREFGDLEFTRRYCSAVDLGGESRRRRRDLATGWMQDVGFALRQLRLRPAFTLVAVVTLALGIGASTAIFSVVRGVLLKPLPYAEPDRLVRLFNDAKGERIPLSLLDIQDFRERARSFGSVAALLESRVNLTSGEGDAERLHGARVSANFFATIGVSPARGRVFAPRGDAEQGPREVVLSDALWRRRFGGDPSIIGRSITLDDVAFTVVGIMPAGRGYPADADVWSALDFTRDLLTPPLRGARFLRAVARLAPGVTLAQARDDMRRASAQLALAYPQQNATLGSQVVTLADYTLGDVRTPLLVLLGAVGLVLLIACVNVANLLLVRAASRETELAVRSAIGAGRGRLVSQLLIESVVLSAISGIAGSVVAVWATRALVAIAPPQIPRLDQVHVDGLVLAVTATVAVLTGIAFGLAPAIYGARLDLLRALRDGRRGSGRAMGRALRRSLVVAEVALSATLLASAALLIKSFARLERVDPGFRSSDVVTFSVSLPAIRYGDDARRRAFADELLRAMRRAPGVRSAALVSGVPMSGASFALVFHVSEQDDAAREDKAAQVRLASPGYFATMTVPIVRGRALDERDRAGAPSAVVINEAMARRFFPDDDPIGKHLRFDFGRPLGGEIVGVARDVKQYGLDASVEPEAFLSTEQFPWNDLSIVARTASGESDRALRAGRDIVRSLDPLLPVFGASELDQLIADSVSRPRFYTVLLGAFAAVALVLATVGVYGVISYAVAQRTHELGIRIALGAARRDVLSLVMSEGLVLALVGVAIGIAGAIAAARIGRTLLFDVSPTDPMALSAGAAVLVAAALAATLVPARRASRVDPIIALRGDV